MALTKTPVSWPVTGGIATKNAPIMLQPGAHLVLDNVRQERANEWRTRSGIGQSSLDDLPGGNVPVIATEAPWGGLVALCRQADNATAARVYTSTALPRWTSPKVAFNVSGAAQQCSQSTPGIWSRVPISAASDLVSMPSGAEGGNYRLSAWWSQTVLGFGMSLTDKGGMTLRSEAQFGGFTTAIRPRCIYSSVANMLVLAWATTTGFIQCVRFDTTTGLQVGSVSTLSPNAVASVSSYLDGIYYGGATVTLAFRDNVGTGGLRIIEYNPTTDVATEYTPGQNAQFGISLFPDPDASGSRYVGVCSSVPETRVVRLSSVGVIQTNDLVVAARSIDIAGCAYQSTTGTPGWMVVTSNLAAPWLTAWKRRSGVTSAAANIAPAGFLPNLVLASNAWREPGTDTMHYMVGVIGTAPDLQPTYLEMALEFENGQSTISNQWTEPQARLLPLTAGAGIDQVGSVLPQVQRTGTDRFVTALSRVTMRDLPGDLLGGYIGRYAVDAWAVQYLNGTTYTNQNNGQGCTTQQAAYLPVGSLLHSATGRLLTAHGSSALPFQPVLTPGNSGSGLLTPGQAYSYVTTTEFTDDAGNLWASEPSIAATASVAAMAGKNQISVVSFQTPFENSARLRTVKFWRTQGNGSAYFLVHEFTDTVANTTVITWLDQVADTSLSEPISGELQGTITPAASHVVFWNRRLWIVDRDFPTRVRFSKPIQAGQSPQFPVDFVIDTDDGMGAATGLAALDNCLVLFKGRAQYVASGDGPDNTGNGAYVTFSRVSSETGNISGGPFVSTGAEVYMTALGGVFSLDRSQNSNFVGAAIDGYLSMPLLQSEETVIGMVVHPEKNEVRIQTTHYRFVHDRVFNIWLRDTGGFGSATVVMTKMLGGVTQCFLTSDGHLWIESADSAAPGDPIGAALQGIVRSPWVRPVAVGGWMHFYRARAEGTVTSPGTVNGAELRIFFDDDDNLFEIFTPPGNIAATAGLLRIEARPQRAKVSSFSLQLKLPTNDATVRLEEWWVVVAPKIGAPPPSRPARWSNGVIPTPPVSPPSLIPVPEVSTIPVILTSRLLGSVNNNQADLLVQTVSTYLAKGWSVVQSYDGLVVGAPGVNMWVDYTSIRGASGGGGLGGAWMVIKNAVNALQVCLFCTVSSSSTGWNEQRVVISPAAGFTGGTTTARPTATDELVDTDTTHTAWLGTGPVGSPQFYSVVWAASDFSYLRTMWIYGGKSRTLWHWDQLQACPTGFTKNFVLGAWKWGNTDYTVTGNRPTTVSFTANWGSGGSYKQVLVPAGPDVSLAVGGSLSASPGTPGTYLPDQAPVANELSGQYIIVGRLGYITAALSPASKNGYWGNSRDIWFTVPSVFSDCDTMGDHNDFIIFNQVVLQWGLGPVAGRLGESGSVNYPTARWLTRGGS